MLGRGKHLKSRRLVISAFSVMLLSFMGGVPSLAGASSNNAETQSISQVKSGLIFADSLITGDTARWTFFGDAIAQNAPYKFSEDSTGLHLGVSAATAGTYIGFYARSPNTPARLFHAVITLPANKISDGTFQTGLYVQTSAPLINYVTCAAGVNQEGYWWTVVETYGNSQQATKFMTLWFQWMNNQPLTRDCTIITNGSNFLQVYLDGTLVFASDSMHLRMRQPFNSYLEVTSTSANNMYVSTYTDYYETQSALVKVEHVPQGSTVELTAGSTVLSKTVGEHGDDSDEGKGTSVVFDIGPYHLPLVSSISVYNSDHELISTTSGPISIWGGDVYSMRGSEVSQDSGDSEH